MLVSLVLTLFTYLAIRINKIEKHTQSSRNSTMDNSASIILKVIEICAILPYEISKINLSTSLKSLLKKIPYNALSKKILNNP